MASKSAWTTVSQKPLTGGLDTRSRPADLLPGWFREKLNFSVSEEGKLFRSAGLERFHSDAESPNGFPNYDLHRQGGIRSPIQFFFESTSPEGVRRLFSGTHDKLWVLDEATGTQTELTSGRGTPGSVWQAAELSASVIFTNDIDAPLIHDLGDVTPLTNIPSLAGVGVTAAKVIIQFAGYVIMMNVISGGVRAGTRVIWCDLNQPKVWSPLAPDSLASFLDLPYGDDILAAAVLRGSVWIFTRRSIWEMNITAATADQVFGFTRKYNEPENQRGCIAYPRTLVSDGNFLRYMARDGWYRWNGYMASPSRNDENDDPWLYLASGMIYTDAATKMSGKLCNAPCAEYLPGTNELWVSWPSGTGEVNDVSMVAQLKHKTATMIDTGFSAFVNYRRNATEGCDENQEFLGASTVDFCIKSIGRVWYREFLLNNGADETADQAELAPVASYVHLGYYSRVRGMIALGFSDREKKLRNVLLDCEVTDDSSPVVARLRIGNSYTLADPNSLANCSPLWRTVGDRALECPNSMTLARMAAFNLKPAVGVEWPVMEQGRFLYFELLICSAAGGVAVGGAVYCTRLDFDVMVLPK